MLSFGIFWAISFIVALLSSVLGENICAAILAFCFGSFFTVTVLGLSRQKEHTTKTYQLEGSIEIQKRNGRFPMTTFWFKGTKNDTTKRVIGAEYIINFVENSHGEVIVHSNAVPSLWQLWFLTRPNSPDWYEFIVPDTRWIQIRPNETGGGKT
jgi:hypothetical protein